MGWFWGSAQAPEASKQPASIDATRDPRPSSTKPAQRSTSSSSAATAPLLSMKAPPTRDQLAEAELRSFLQSLEASSTLASDSLSTSAANPTSSPLSETFDPSTPTPLTTAHTLPSSVSCRTIFDNAFHCQSLGGQWNSIYRHGSFRKCSELWYDFWWCMRTNRGSMTDGERATSVRKRYEAKEKQLREGPNSEDIWQERKTLVGRVWDERYEKEEGGNRGDREHEQGRGSMKGLYGG